MYKEFKADEDKKKAGVWVEWYDDDGVNDFRVLLAYASRSNKAYNAAIEKHNRVFRRNKGIRSVEQATRVMIDVMVDSIIKDWQRWFVDEEGEGYWDQGIEAEDGSTIPFNADNVRMTLENIPELADELQMEAEKVSNFQNHPEPDNENDLGN